MIWTLKTGVILPLVNAIVVLASIRSQFALYARPTILEIMATVNCLLNLASTEFTLKR